MAFTDERIEELTARYGLTKIDPETNDSIFRINAETIKLYHATYSELTTNQKDRSYLTDEDIDIWTTVLVDQDIFEVLFELDPFLKDADNKYSEITN